MAGTTWFVENSFPHGLPLDRDALPWADYLAITPGRSPNEYHRQNASSSHVPLPFF